MTQVHMQLNYKRKLQVDQAVVKPGNTFKRALARTIICAWKMQTLAAAQIHASEAWPGNERRLERSLVTLSWRNLDVCAFTRPQTSSGTPRLVVYRAKILLWFWNLKLSFETTSRSHVP